MQFKEIGALFSHGKNGEKGEFASNILSILGIGDKRKTINELNSLFDVDKESGISKYTTEEIKKKGKILNLNQNDLDIALSKASDAGFFEKAKAKTITWNEALKDTKLDLNDIADGLKGELGEKTIDDIMGSEKSLEQKRAALANMVAETENLGSTMASVGSKTEATGMFDGIKNAAKGALVSLKAMAPAIIAVGAAYGAYKLWDYSQTGYTRAKEKAEASASTYSEDKSNLQSLQQELDTTKSKIEELNATKKQKGGLSLTDEAELSRLEQENAQLERKVAIQKQLTEISAQAASSDARKAANTAQTYWDHLKEKNGGGFFGTLKSIPEYFATKREEKDGKVYLTKEKNTWEKENGGKGNTTLENQTKANIKTLKDYQSQLEDIETQLGSSDLTKGERKSLQKQQKELSENIADTKQTLSTQTDQLQQWIDASYGADGKLESGASKYVDNWNKIINDVNNTIGQKTKTQIDASNLDTYFNSSSGSAMKEYLENIVEEGGSAQDALDAFRESGMRLKDIDVSENGFLTYFEDVKRQAEEAKQAAEDYSASVSDVESATESANQDKDWSTIQSAYKAAKESLKEGKTGTDDFQTMAKFLNSNAVKKYAEQGGKYTADAYQKAFQEAMGTADRWFGDDEASSMKNFVNDFKNKGLWDVSTDAMGLWDIKTNFNTTAEAADKFGMSVESVETMLHGLEAYGYDFSDIMFSAEGLDEYKTALDGIKSTYDEMTDGAAKDRLGSLIDSFESEYDKFQNGDLKNLTKDQIVKIKFEYDLSQVEQKTQELIDQAANSGSNNDLAGAIVSQKKERDLLEGRTKYTKDSDEGYSYSYDQIDKLQQKMTGATKTERAEINKQILAYQEMQNNFQKYRLDGGDLNWNDYLDTPSATAAFDEIIKKGLMTKDQLKDLFGEKATYEIDAKLNDDDLQSKLKKLKSGESITFKADVDDIETDVEAVKNEDGTVTYTANVGGVPKEVNKIADADGKIHYTADFDGSKEWLENNLEKEETITFKADVAGVTQDIQAYKDEDGTIHYYSVLDNGTRKELEQHKNEDGTITYTTTADTSGVEKATKKAKENAEKNKIELEITAKDTNLVDKYIQEKQKSDAAKSKLSNSEAVHGNVDSRDRPMIYWDKENLKSNKSALKSWGQNPKDLKGSYSTVMGGSDEFQGIEIAYTPVLKTGDGKGEVISKNTMSKYINTLIDQAKSAGDGNWTTEDLLKLDSEGLLVDGKKISNMIADVGDTAKETGEKMHDIDDSLYSEDYAKYWDEISEKAEKANMSVEDYVNTVASTSVTSDNLVTKDNGFDKVVENAKNAVETLKGLGNENLKLDFDFKTTNLTDIENQIQQAKSNLDQFKNDDGTVNMSINGAQEAVTILETLIQQKQQASNPVIMEVSTSGLDSGVSDAVSKLKEYQNALNQLNTLNELKTAGVQIDDSQISDAEDKVNSLFDEIQKASNKGQFKINADVSVDSSSQEKLQSDLKNMTPEIKAKITADDSDTKKDGKTTEAKVNYKKGSQEKPSPKNAKVNYKKGSQAKPSPKNAKVNYKKGSQAKPTSPKTATVNYKLGTVAKPPAVTVKVNYDTSGAPKVLGTAHAKGSTGGLYPIPQLSRRALASGTLSDSSWLKDRWRTKDSEMALVGEVGKELVVSGNRWYTVGDNGAEFAHIPAGSIVFNSKQTDELLKKGFTNSRGKGNISLPGTEAFASGTAYRLGSGTSSTTNAKKNTSSGTKSSRTSKAKSSSGSNTKSKSNSNSKSSESAEKSEELLDWIETLLSRTSRLTELATSAVDRAVGLANKQNALVDAVTKTQNEITTNQNSANEYFAKADSLKLAPGYADKIKNGTLDIESITDDNLKDKISKYKEYYEKGLSAQDKVLDLQDKLNELYQKRLEIIEKEYDTIVEVNDSLKDMLDAKISYNSAYGVANDNQDNIDSINKSIKAQEDTFNQLTKKFDEYQKEVNSQITSGVLKQGSEDYRSAQKNLNDFTANIYKASQELIELQDKLVQLRVDAIQTIIDTFKRRSDKLDKYSSLLEAKDETVPESVYQERLDNNNDTIRKNQQARAIWLKRQATEDVNSDNYKKYAEEIQKLDESTLDLMKDNEDLKNSIYSLRIKNLEDAIQGYDDLETELKGFRDLLNDDAFLDKNGGITDEGLAQITLLSQSIGNAKQKISDLTTGLQKVKELYDNGVISLKEYNEKSAEYRKELQSSTSDVKSYQKSLTDLYQNALKTEVDALQKVIDKRKSAQTSLASYYDYQKKISSQTNDINALRAQAKALEGVNDAASMAKLKKIQAEVKEKESDLNDTKRDHRNDLISKGYDQMSQDLSDLLEDTEYEISHNADKQNEIIQSMLNKQVGMYQEAYSKINSIIKNTGWVGSNDFNNNQSQMSSQTGAQNQASNASQSQQTANKKPSSSASGTDTSGIKDNASENNKITENIMKPENTTNRPVAELTVSKSSVSIEEGKSTSVTTKIRPNDAANKKLSWKSSNTAIATVSNGTISGKKPGSCQITVSTTDGSGISKTIAVTVTKKPDPPKPAIPSNKGGDGVPRVGDVVTFNGKYYYDSWGKRPAGSLYSGVKNGVVIDSYSSRDYGGSARYTGDLKVHIKSADGRYGDLGWVRLSQISGYAKGTPGVDRDQIAIVDEEGRELQIPNGKGGRITKLEKSTGVIPHTPTEKLMALSEQLDNNGNMVINGRTIEEYINDMANMQSIAVPDFSDVTASVVSQLEGKGMGNVTVENHYDSLLTVEGNVDKDALPGLEDILKRSYEYTSKQMVKELRKGGMQIRR